MGSTPSRAGRRASLTAACVLVASALTACGSSLPASAVQRIAVCAGVDAQHPATSNVLITLRQGGREVASAGAQPGILVAFLVPDGPTAVLVDGREVGSVGWDGGHPDPASDPQGAPDDATVQAAAATDPTTVAGHVALTWPGCPPADQLDPP